MMKYDSFFFCFRNATNTKDDSLGLTTLTFTHELNVQQCREEIIQAAQLRGKEPAYPKVDCANVMTVSANAANFKS